MTIRPNRKAILSVIIATSFIWGLGLIGLYQDPFDLEAWLAVGLAAVIIGYVVTQKIVVRDGKVRAFRYFILRAQADAHSAKLVPAQIGQPPVLRGFAVIAADNQTVVEIAPWNFAADDVDRLRAALAK